MFYNLRDFRFIQDVPWTAGFSWFQTCIGALLSLTSTVTLLVGGLRQNLLLRAMLFHTPETWCHFRSLNIIKSLSSSSKTLRYTTFTYFSGLIFVVCDLRDLPDLHHLTRINYFLGYIKMESRGAQTPDARSPERLNFVLCLKILVLLQLRIFFMSLFWHLGFSGDC